MRKGLRVNMQKAAPSTINATRSFVLFGITGDLAKQKIIPALFALHSKGEISNKTSFFGFGRKDFSLQKQEFHNFLRECLEKIQAEESVKNKFIKNWKYIHSEIDSDAGFKDLKYAIPKTSVPLVYISLPPQLQKRVCEKILVQKIITKVNGGKLMIEKPYGFDARSATALESLLASKLDQDQILRVDHYAGKQALIELEQEAQKGDFDLILNKNSVQKITFNFCETLDVSVRGAFYDSVGALRDVFQNHLLHEFATICALPFYGANTGNAANSIENHARLREMALESFLVTKKPVFKQYKGYRHTKGVRADSTTETYFKVEAKINSKSAHQEIVQTWQGVKFIFEGGKALPIADSSIKIYFKKLARKSVLKDFSKENPLIIHMNGHGEDAYIRVLRDAFIYDQNRFISFEQARLGWKIVEQIEKYTKLARRAYPQKNLKNPKIRLNI